MQNEITTPSRLLDKNGELIQKGYAKSLILDYKREDVKKKIRLKEWDYYLIYNEYFAVALTIAGFSGGGLISASFIDFKNTKEKTKSIPSIFPVWRVKMPESSVVGDINYKDMRVEIYFKHVNNGRNLYIKMRNFEGKSDLEVSMLLKDEPEDSMVIATPFKEDKRDFYYNQKIVGMKASGQVIYNRNNYIFSDCNSLGLLDWGRGVWPYVSNWYWSAAQGIVNGMLFGFNLGYGFGETSEATENMVFLNGKGYKLDDIVFDIPKDFNNEVEYMKNWNITSSDGRFVAEFHPIVDRNADLSLVIVSSEQHQVFGKFTGVVKIDDDENREIHFNNLLGFAEQVKNKW